MLPNWDGTTSGSISVKFRTNEPDGLLFFSRGQTEHTVSRYKIDHVCTYILYLCKLVLI